MCTLVTMESQMGGVLIMGMLIAVIHYCYLFCFVRVEMDSTDPKTDAVDYDRQ